MFKFSLPLLLDGGTATNLFKLGMPRDCCYEKWILENREKFIEFQKQYIAAGADVLTAPTFSANRVNLKKFGLQDKVESYNKELVALSVEAAGSKAAICGNISPTGINVEPFGENTFDTLLSVFSEQAFALKDAGCDYLALETFTNLIEARAALIAAKETGLPVSITFAIDKNLKLIGGGDVLATLVTAAAMGADAVGLNCSGGPRDISDALSGIAKHIPVPLIAKPSAGLPDKDGNYMSADDFAAFVPELLKEGVGIIGGCCGTDATHIAKIHEVLSDKKYTPRFSDDDITIEGVRDFIVTNEKQVFFVSEEDMDFSHKIYCDPEMEDKLLELDGANTCARIVIESPEDAKEFSLNSFLCTVPVVFLGYDEKSLEEALKLYSGRAMIDIKSDISKDALERLSKKYGAVII